MIPVILGRVRELLVNSEKTRISSIFKKDAERFLCLQFSITHAHYLILFKTEIHSLTSFLLFNN